MENHIFVNLLRLYSKHAEKTPSEDFTTEALAGVLKSDQTLLDQYVNKVLSIDGKNFDVQTQKRYSDSIIDMVFKNNSSICFVENKVDSVEGHKQLQKYAKILTNVTSGEKIYLRYCTKYFDKKQPDDYQPLTHKEFEQFRWLDVYKFLKSQDQNPFVSAFLVFLKEYDMSDIPDFTYEDLITMREMPTTIQKMEECFELVTPRFTELFGPPYTRDYASLKQIPQESQYTLWTSNILQEEWAEISIAFGFEDEEKSPLLYAQCYCYSGYRFYSDFKDAFKNSKFQDLKKEEDEEGYSVWFEMPLSNFVSSDNQFKEITGWFIKKLELFAEFMRQDTTVKWNLPKDA